MVKLHFYSLPQKVTSLLCYTVRNFECLSVCPGEHPQFRGYVWAILDIRGMFEMNCLFLSGDFKFQVSPKVLSSCPRVLPMARNATFQPMYPLLEGVTVR